MNEASLPEGIENRIYLTKNEKVPLDSDLAGLYRVQTQALIQAVKRNASRFPFDFCFQLSDQKVAILRSQIVTSSWRGRRLAPHAFTEQGVAMRAATS
jgi:hypothetical protein